MPAIVSNNYVFHTLSFASYVNNFYHAILSYLLVIMIGSHDINKEKILPVLKPAVKTKRKQNKRV